MTDRVREEAPSSFHFATATCRTCTLCSADQASSAGTSLKGCLGVRARIVCRCRLARKGRCRGRGWVEDQTREVEVDDDEEDKEDELLLGLMGSREDGSAPRSVRRNGGVRVGRCNVRRKTAVGESPVVSTAGEAVMAACV